MKFLNRLLYQIHRWVGLVLALFMFAWFLTGLIILYSPSMNQNRSQQLAHAETLAPELGWLSLGEAWQRSAEQRAKLTKAQPGKTQEASEVSVVDARLVRRAGQPVWLIEDNQAQRYALSAVDGSLQDFSPEQALAIAENWYRLDGHSGNAMPRYLETVENPLMLRNQDALKPFYRIAIGDNGGELLISKRTGELLHASDTISRGFYWAGNWLHLLKPMELIGWGAWRHDAQVWLSFSATLATLTGLIIGWLRWRPGLRGKPTYSEGRTQPYREFWFKWHFWSGLLGGSAALFWALSGYFDTNPGKIFSQTTPSKPELNRFIGNAFPDLIKNWQPILPLTLTAAVEAEAVVELNWRRIGEHAHLLANTRDGRRLPQALSGVPNPFTPEVLTAALARLDAKTPIATQTLLDHYDSYYYPRHNQSALDRPLPVILVTLADAQSTRYYLDPQEGKLLAKFDRSARVLRWLYSALHHWDFGWLYYRPLWDVWMLTWIGFGLVLGGTSLIIGWRLLKKTVKVKKRRPELATRRYVQSEV